MINWLHIKKASDPWAPYTEDFFRPITEAEARAMAAYKYGTPLAQIYNPELQHIYDADKDQHTIGGVPVYLEQKEDSSPEWFYENGQPVKRYYSVYNGDGSEITDEKDWWRRANEATSMEEADRYHDISGVSDYLRPDGSVIHTNSYGYKPLQDYTTREDWRTDGYPNFVEHLGQEALEKSDYSNWRDKDSLSPEEYNSFINTVDPNGYMRKYGLLVEDNEDSFMNGRARVETFREFMRRRAGNTYLNFLHNEKPEEYQALTEELGYSPIEQMQEYKDPRQAALEKLQKRQAKAAKRWDNSQVQLTPEEYAYYDAKQKYNADPNDIRWNMMSQAQKNLSQGSLNRVKQYGVQERIRNTPTVNGMRKTPQQMQQEYNQELRRREATSRDMYKNEQKGLKNRTGVIPTMVNTWSTDPRYKEVTK